MVVVPPQPDLPPYAPNLLGLDDATVAAVQAREIECESDVYTVFTPRVGGTDPVALLSQFLGFCQPNKGIVFEVYQDSLPAFYLGLEAAIERSCWSRGLFDKSQSSGVAMHPWMQWLAVHFGTQADQMFGIGTSDQHGQILHRKAMAINVPADGSPWPPARQYGSWKAAAADGYPVMWSGSWNLSKDATWQANNLDILPGVVRTAVFAADVAREFAWVKANQPAFQTPLIPA